MADRVYVTTTIITGVNDTRFINGLIPKNQRIAQGFLDTMKQDNWKNWIDRKLLQEEGVFKENEIPFQQIEEGSPNEGTIQGTTPEPHQVTSGSPVIPPVG